MFLELQKSLLVCFWGCWTQWQRFESSSIHHFWDTPLHVSQNTCFSLEIGFLSFLELQKSSTSKFLGVLNTMAKVWNPAETVSEILLQQTSQTTHSLPMTPQVRAEMTFIPGATQKLGRLVSYFGGAEHNGKGLKALAFTISEIPHSIFSKHIFA